MAAFFSSHRSLNLAVFCSLLVISLGGCSIKNPPPPELAPSTKVPDKWTAETPPNVGDVDVGWLGTFNDRQLDKIVDEAIANNLDLQTAAAQLEVARGFARKAGAELYPLVTLGASGAASGGYESEDTTTNQSSISLNVSWELDLWGRVRSGKAAATADYEAAMADYSAARLSLAALTAKSWFLAVEAKLQVELSEDIVALYERMVQIVEVRYTAGLVSMLDVHFARTQLALQEENLRQARSGFEVAIRSLEIILGRYPDAETQLATELATMPPPVRAGLPSELLERRPDLIASGQALAAAFHTVTQAKAARLPTISLTGSTGSASSALRDIINAPNPFWNLAANLFAPLFTGGELQANVDIATAQQQAALAQYGQAALGAFSEVETALANEELLKDAVSFQETVVEEGRQAARLASIQYDVGVIDFLSVIQVQDTFVNAQRRLLGLKDRRLANRINLHLSLGGSF